MSSWKHSLFRLVDRSHQRFNDAVKDRWPWMSVWLYHRPRSRFLHYRFERALLAGREFQVAARPSILFFTTHKAASMFVDRVLKRLGQAHGMLHADLEGWFSTGPPKLWRLFKDPAAMKQLFRPRGIYYGALRSHRPIADLENYRVVLMLRDPRDMLTSYYFSEAFSHSPINQRVLERRRKAAAQDINAFVLEHAPLHKAVYETYFREFDGRPEVLFTTYERMLADRRAWLNEIVEHVGLTEHPGLVEDLLQEAAQVKGTGSAHQHVRVARSGDHRDKLSPDTIARLNDLFGQELLERFRS